MLKLSVTYLHRTYNLNTNLFGSYNIENVRAAIATGLFLGAEIKEIIEAVKDYKPANNRSQVKKTDKNTIICDSYNANPTSMRLALDSFSAMKSERKVVILGDMLELGERSEEEHLKIVNSLSALNAEKVLLVGQVFHKVAAKSGYKAFSKTEKLVQFLKSEQMKGKTILVKGSRGLKLENIYDLL